MIVSCYLPAARPPASASRIMAFFGLTALGPQNSFRASLLDFSYLDVFTEADQDNAFRLVDVDSRGYLDLEQIDAFLTALYHGVPKACDSARFSERMKLKHEGCVTLNDIRSTMDELKKELEEESNNAKWQRGSGSEFNSNQAFRETVRRHEHIARGPRERYDRTVTAVQEHGWRDQSEANKQIVHGKKSCAETVYASELVKSGVYF